MLFLNKIKLTNKKAFILGGFGLVDGGWTII